MGNDALAPVAFFAYARPEHTRRSLASLQANELAADTHLFVFADAARGPHDRDHVEATRAVVRQFEGFASLTVVERSDNLGLARNIIDGVTSICSRFGRVIVLEDDLVLSRHFLRYMNDALRTYADDARVASIHGYCYPMKDPLPATYFLRGADCWGWATWQRAWAGFQTDGTVLLRELERSGLARSFDLDGSYPYTRMLKHQIAGKNDSWAIRWHASCFLADQLTLHPGVSLVQNIGNDGSGRHGSSARTFDQTVSARPVPVEIIDVKESVVAVEALARMFRSEPLLTRIGRRIYAPRTKRLIRGVLRRLRREP